MKAGGVGRPVLRALLSAVFGFCATSFGQSNNPATTTSVADRFPDLVELDPFGGVSLWGTVSEGLREKLADGGTAGGRVAVNFSRYVGLELGYNFMINNVRLLTPIQPGLPTYNFGNQIHYLALNPVVNLRPRGAGVQPYLTVGVGAIQFTPTKQARDHARLPSVDAVYHSANLNDNLQAALNYGGGIKFHLSEHFGLRFDGRGIWSRNGTFNLPNYNDGGIYIPSRRYFNGFEGTIGLVIYLGQGSRPVAATAPPPAPLNAGNIAANAGTLCAGQAITVHSSASDPAGSALRYIWKVNGQPADSHGPDLTFTPDHAGDYQLEVMISDPSNLSRSVTSGPVTLTVEAGGEPSITSISAMPNALSCPSDPTGEHVSNLTGQASGSACGGNLTYSWSVSEGTLSSNSGPTTTLDSKTVAFESGAQNQSKTVTATLKVTDQSGKSASKSTDVVIRCPAQIVRLPDIIFAKNNDRVNNCGKRILIDQAAPRVSGGEYNIVLIGHVDADERLSRPGGKSRRHNLDEQRVLNAAAVLSGGGGTCAKVDPARIRVDWVGTEQSSAPDPGLCGTSNLPAEKERKGSEVSGADKNRRVEVYLVPSAGSVVPPAGRNVRALPEREVRLLGCPK